MKGHNQEPVFVIEGGYVLSGIVKISGSKNYALPIMAASLLPVNRKTVLRNLPLVDDVNTFKQILGKLGSKTIISNNEITISPDDLNNCLKSDADLTLDVSGYSPLSEDLYLLINFPIGICPFSFGYFSIYNIYFCEKSIHQLKIVKIGSNG